MRPYAAAPGRLVLQLLADALLLVWVVLCVRAGRAVHAAVERLVAPGLRLRSGAGGLSDSLTSAARSAGRLPLVGSRLATPLRSAGGAADQVSSAGASLAAAAHELAGVLEVVVIAAPIAVALALWLPPRLRFALRAGAAARALDGRGGDGRGLDAEARTRLLALRALTTLPVGALARTSADPVGDVARADPAVLARLADLERRRLGLPRQR